jgi:tetratricopeptide (TPR) repeat protein
LTTADAWSLARSSKLEFDLASIAFNRGDAAEAARRLRAAADVNPRNGIAWLRLVDLKRASGDLDGARAIAAEARASNPHNSRLARALETLLGGPGVK